MLHRLALCGNRWSDGRNREGRRTWQQDADGRREASCSGRPAFSDAPHQSGVSLPCFAMTMVALPSRSGATTSSKLSSTRSVVMPFDASPTSIEMSPREAQPPSLSVTAYMTPDVLVSSLDGQVDDRGRLPVAA